MTHPADRGAWEWLAIGAVCAAIVLASLYGCGGSFSAGEVSTSDAGEDSGLASHVLVAIVEASAPEAAPDTPACPSDDGGNPWAHAGPIPCPSSYACAVPAVGYECLDSKPATLCLADGAVPTCATQAECWQLMGASAQCSGGYCRLGCQ